MEIAGFKCLVDRILSDGIAIKIYINRSPFADPQTVEGRSILQLHQSSDRSMASH